MHAEPDRRRGSARRPGAARPRRRCWCRPACRRAGPAARRAGARAASTARRSAGSPRRPTGTRGTPIRSRDRVAQQRGGERQRHDQATQDPLRPCAHRRPHAAPGARGGRARPRARRRPAPTARRRAGSGRRRSAPPASRTRWRPEDAREEHREEQLDRVVGERRRGEPRGLAGLAAQRARRAGAAAPVAAARRRGCPSSPRALASQVNWRERACAASPIASSRGGSATRSRTARSRAPPGHRPGRRSRRRRSPPPARRRAAPRSACAHAPASITVRHQPSADEAVSATHARLQQLRPSRASLTWPWKRHAIGDARARGV